MNRRQILGTTAGVLAILSGCAESRSASQRTDSPTDSPTMTETPTHSPTETETSTEPCQRDLKRITGEWAVETGELGGFKLTVSEKSVPLGGTLTVRLTNTTDEERDSGIKAKYDIQRETATDWQSIIRYEGGGWEDPAIGHEPGEGYRWELTLAQDGFSRLREDRERELGPDYYVCDPLEPGTYRFLYFGIALRSTRKDALGVQFTITRD